MTVAGIISLMFSLAALGLSYYVFRTNRAVTSYSNIDRMYFDLLKMAMADPDFVNPDFTLDYEHKFVGKEQIRYGLYAFQVWNLCETIYDNRKSGGVLESWQPVLDHENALHRKWFDEPLNRKKFKESFGKYLDETVNQNDGQNTFPKSYKLLK
jgi:hypothetical protein